MSLALKFRYHVCDYLRHSNIKCFKYLLANDRPLIERLVWLVSAVSWIVGIVWIVTVAYTTLLLAPTVISEISERSPISDIHFPAVALCSENRISRRSLLEYAQFVLNTIKNRTSPFEDKNVTEIADSLLLLGKMYSLEASDADFYRMDRLHSVLLQVYDGPYPFHEILANLTPSCDDLLQSCRWAGENVKCKQIFRSRRTSEGICCTFNYLRPSPLILGQQSAFNGSITVKAPVRVSKHGHQHGLSVLVNQLTDDYAFAIHSKIGSRVLIYGTTEFPDNISGAVTEKFLSVGVQMFLSISARIIVGAEEMRKYRKESRNCAFPDEIPLIYENFYSLSECLLTCRLRDIVGFCGCIPPQFLNIIPNQSMCMLHDMPCLKRWKSKWFNVEPIAVDVHTVVTDLHCPACLPLCNFVKLSGVSTKATVLYNLTNGNTTNKYSIVHANFGKSSMRVFHQTPLFMWYELLAAIGGMVTLMLGASFMSIVEIVYFGTCKFGCQAVQADEQNDAKPTLIYPDDFRKLPNDQMRNLYTRRKRLTRPSNMER